MLYLRRGTNRFIIKKVFKLWKDIIKIECANIFKKNMNLSNKNDSLYLPIYS